jgi:hypothetical protein
VFDKVVNQSIEKLTIEGDQLAKGIYTLRIRNQNGMYFNTTLTKQ